MLKLNGITKIYEVADEKVAALNGINITFRKSEFVSVLGPSGCGKTTLLNIIGGLDGYTSGELEIDGVSTSDYSDRDWDAYRNHSIGFVFQNYNLIPHLTVLENVELALALVGEDKEKRKSFALAALETVGLRNKAYKKPNQLSGGQMQRVAIARAVINNPEIILADEPTGALDSETSVQIMGILKNISRTRLVIMVTHNGELAREYSTRIIRLFDGKLVGDTSPYTPEEKPDKNLSQLSENTEKSEIKKTYAVRFINGAVSENISPLTEKETAEAVKIYTQTVGDVKFAVLTVGNGKYVTPLANLPKKRVKGGFIDKNVLGGNERAEVEAAFGIKKKSGRVKRREDKYSVKPAMKLKTAFRLSLNNLLTKKFRTFLTAFAGSIGILGIGLVLGLYSGLNSFIDRQEVALSSYPITITRSVTDYEAMISTVVSSLDGLDGKYDRDKVYVYKLVQQILRNQTNVNEFDAEMIKAIKDIDEDLYYDIYENYGLNFNVVRKIDSGTKLLGTISTTSMYYLSVDTSRYWAQLPSKELVSEQYELIAGEYPKNRNELVLILDGKNQISDINMFFNGLDMESVTLDYKDGEDVSGLNFPVTDFVGQSFRLVANDSYYVKNGTSYEKNETTKPAGTIKMINDAIRNNVGAGYQIYIFRGDSTNDEGASYVYTKSLANSETLTISGVIKLKDDVSVGVLGTSAIGYTKELTDRVIDWAYESAVVQSKLEDFADLNDAELTEKLKPFGYATVPTSLSIYCRNYQSKSSVKAAINRISDARKAEGKSGIAYSDLMSVVLNVVQQFIKIITYSLLCLTAISLIVSALMIGIITYVSVLERTREIGVLRALGARKLDISRIFNAETVLLGFGSGVLGVIITYILSWPIGALLAKFTGIAGLVSLSWYYALALVLLSTCLTLIAGLIPATMAKRKNPVTALRSE